MDRKFLVPLATSLLVAGFQAPLRADGAADKVQGQLNQLYRLLATTLASPDKDSKNVLILASPGLPISSDFEQNPDNKDADDEILYSLADVVPKANGSYVPNGEWRYSGIYKMIMDNSQLLGKTDLSQDEEDRLEKAQAWMDLTNPDGGLKFKNAQDAYLDAFGKYLTAKAAKAPDVAVLQARADNLRTAFAGLQNQYDSYGQQIRQITSKGGGARWTQLANKFANAAVGDNYKTVFNPSPSSWADPKDMGWLAVTVKGQDTAKDLSSSSSNITVQVGYHSGTVGVDADFNKNDFKADAALSDSSYQISFQVKRVSVIRNWLDYSVFYNRAWKLPSNIFRGVFSMGTAQDNAKNDLPMPTYVTNFFLVRKLVIQSSAFKSSNTEFMHALGVHASVSVGPFSIKGGYDKRDTGKHAESHFEDGKVECEGVQIIGFMATIPPVFPNPDPALAKQ